MRTGSRRGSSGTTTDNGRGRAAARSGGSGGRGMMGEDGMRMRRDENVVRIRACAD